MTLIERNGNIDPSVDDARWEDGRKFRYDCEALTTLLRGQVPVLDYVQWGFETIEQGQTLSVLPQYRGEDIGGRLLAGVWSRLEERDVDEMAITTALANVDSHRFYERHGFQPAFLLYYGRREKSEA